MEAMTNMIIGGMNWKSGDEAVMAEQDYGAMLEHFKMIAKRFGVVNNVVSVPVDSATGGVNWYCHDEGTAAFAVTPHVEEWFVRSIP